MKKNTEQLQKLVNELLNLMAVSAEGEVVYNKEEDAYEVNIDAKDQTGLLIGKKGETLSSLQTVLSLIFKQKIGEWKRVIVNVGDWREKEEEYLKNLAQSTAERAKETGEPQSLYNLKPWQRRVIHMYLAEESGIITESEGEGEERYLIVKTKK